MKKIMKTAAAILAACTVILALAGCVPQIPRESGKTVSETASPSTEASGTGSATGKTGTGASDTGSTQTETGTGAPVTATEKTEAEKFFENCLEPVEYAVPAAFEKVENTSASGDFYMLNDEALYKEIKNRYFSINTFGSVILFRIYVYPDTYETAGDESIIYLLYDADRKEIKGKLEEETFTEGFFLGDGSFCVVSTNTGDIRVYGDSLSEPEKTYDGEMLIDAITGERDEENSEYQTVFSDIRLSSDGKYAVAVSASADEIIIADFEGRSVMSVPMEIDYGTFVLEKDGVMYFSDYGETLSMIAVTPADGKAESASSDGNFGSTGDLMFLYQSDDVVYLRQAFGSSLAIIDGFENAGAVTFSAGYLFSLHYNDGIVSLLDLRKGEKYTTGFSGIGGTDYEYDGTCAIIGKNVIFGIRTYDDEGNGECRIALWIPAESGTAFGGVEYYPDFSVADAMNEESEKIKEISGIEMKYGSEGNDFTVFDYCSRVCANDFSSLTALRKLKKLVAGYPEGIFDEMCTSGVKGIKIYLCGSIYSTSSSGISSAGALAFTEGYNRCVAFDITYIGSLEKNFAHEFMHVMDDKISEMEAKTDIPYLSTWNTFVPPDGHGFYFSYHDEKGEEMNDYSNTLTWNKSESDIWFVDAYAKSYPTEDRARIMENLVTLEPQDGFLHGENLLMKARYLCAVIRECFESVKNCEIAPWEKYFGPDYDPESAAAEFEDILKPAA